MASATIKPPRVPRTAEQATVLLDEVARIDSDVAVINGHRNLAISNTNAVADSLALPLIERRDAIVAVIKPWWATAGHLLLTGTRKTLELGGCMIGTKASQTSLGFTDGAFDKAVEALKPLRWAKALLRVKTEVDKKAAKAALDGARGDELRRLGFSIAGGGEIFVLEAVVQPGTVEAR